MKVKELIEALQEYDPGMEVIYAVDDEGNAFYSYSSLGGEMWLEKSQVGKWSVDPIGCNDVDYIAEITEDMDEGETFEDYYERVLCIN